MRPGIRSSDLSRRARIGAGVTSTDNFSIRYRRPARLVGTSDETRVFDFSKEIPRCDCRPAARELNDRDFVKTATFVECFSAAGGAKTVRFVHRDSKKLRAARPGGFHFAGAEIVPVLR